MFLHVTEYVTENLICNFRDLIVPINQLYLQIIKNNHILPLPM